MNRIRYNLMTWLSILSLMLVITPRLNAEDWPIEPPKEAPTDWGPVSLNFEEIDYPWPVQYLELRRYGEKMLMAYMDIPPEGRANGKVVFWQHGHNFYSEPYEDSFRRLVAAGFRVIAVDRIGYGKSSKPLIPYNLNFVSANMKALMDSLGVDKVAAVGHSMGGMVVSRFSMLYPESVSHVAMVNQIGLTDLRQSRSWRDPLATDPSVPSYQSILRGHTRYYPTTWPPQHLEYVRRQYGQTLSGDYPRFARVRAMVSDILYNDPVVYDWQHINTKTLVIGGEEDDLADDFVARVQHVHSELPNSALHLYPGIGHNPQVEIPEQFHADLIRFMESDPDEPASEWR
ncbi:MAG: alpha/beta hydrolase [Gammaproteobacteria bacterium]|nr:alpha/beta hydrolase [Gammaproteobacteria bacterium]MCY4356381.1 alpha/beta hydrolase [Gammaproteobacteria bacterium]